MEIACTLVLLDCREYIEPAFGDLSTCTSLDRAQRQGCGEMFMRSTTIVAIARGLVFYDWCCLHLRPSYSLSCKPAIT